MSKPPGLTCRMFGYGRPVEGYDLWFVGARREETIPVPEIAAPGREATAWVEPAKDERLAFSTVGQSENVNLIPLYKLFIERYTVYWKVNSKTA